MIKEPFQTTKKERFSYPLFALGQILIFGFVGQFANVYFTEFLLIPTSALAVIFFVAKLWDAVNDPIFGAIVDRVEFKKAKFKPWLKFTAFLVPLSTIMLFLIPQALPMTAKISLVAIGYIVWSMIYTVSDVPSFSLMTTLTNNMKERTTLLSYSSVASSLGAILIVVVFVPLINTLGYWGVGLAIGVIACPLLAIYPFVAKERHRYKAPQQKSSFKDIFFYLKKNKFLLLFFLAYIISGSLNVALTNYVMIACLGSLNYLAVFTAIGVVPVIILFLLIPKLAQKFDRMKMYIFCTVSSIILNIIIFFVGFGNVYLYGTLVILRTVIATPGTLLVATFTTDCIEYGQYKSGVRKEGITFSLQTFANKFNSAVASSLAMLLLSVIGYVSGGAAQSVQTLNGLWACASLIPAAASLISLPLLFLYKLKSKDIQIMIDINSGKIERENGERFMSRKY